MRYLRSIESFKKLKYEERILTTELRPIKEQFENDITWGGSLIGRLINSTVRVLGVRYRATKVDGLKEELEKMLLVLLGEESSISEKNKLRELRMNALLAEIYKIVNDTNLSVEAKLQILLSVTDYELRRSRQSGSGTPQNASFSFNSNLDKIFEYAQDKKEEIKDEKDTSGDGIIDITIRDIKSTDIEKKDLLVEKLEKFKKLLMEIEYKKDEEKKDSSKETKKKFKLYSETRKFLEGYLDVIRQIEANAVKQKSPFKKGDIVMWKRTTGASKGTLAFGEVLQDIQENDDNIQVKGLDKGNKFSLPVKLALALTFFDEEYYKKMRETNAKEISLKLIKAKIAYYTFMNKKDRAKMSFYEGEMDRLEKKLPKDRESEFSDLESQDKPQGGAAKPTVGSASGSTNKGSLPQQNKSSSESGLVKASFEYYLDDEHLILEEADVRISTKEQIGAWGYIVDVYSEMKKKTDMKKHMQKISDLLEGKPSGNEARKTITSLGKKILELLTSKYKPVPINDLKNFTKETPTTVVKKESFDFIYEADEAKDSSETAETVADAETICQLARVILSLEQDMTLAKSFVDSKGEGVSKSILKMISSFDGIKDAINEQKKNENNGLLKKYSDFKLILEADDGPEEGAFGDVSDDDDDDDDDSEQSSSGEQQERESETGELDDVQIAWFDERAGGRGPFSRGEEREWVVNIEEVKKPIGPEERKITIEVPDGGLADPKIDPIIRIMNVFGKAYSLYATDYIPSGRPEGRVSQRTLRQYEFIGKGSETEARGERGKDYFTPTYGPWAAKRVFKKWENGVNSILENKWYRKVLANVNYVSQAERETGMEQIEGSSGITLLRFITEMLTLKGTFKENKRTLMLKYFNADIRDDGIDKIKKRDKSPIKNVKGLKTDEPFFSNISQYESEKGANNPVLGAGKNIKPGYFYRVKCKVGSEDKIYILWAFHNANNKILFRAHESDASKPEEAFISKRFQDTTLGYKTKQIIPRSARTQTSKDVFIIGMKYDQVRNFKKGSQVDIRQVKNDGRINANSFEQKTWNISNSNDAIQIMVVPELISDTEARTKPVVVAWSDTFKTNKDSKLDDSKIGELKNKMP